MELTDAIAALSDPRAYPFPVENVDVRQTHISVVFLAGELVYKIKKPVDLGFLDFTTLEKRHRMCHEEVRLNRRLAPGIYLGVVPVARRGADIAFESEGEVIEWAVKMQRLADQATLEYQLEHGAVSDELVSKLAGKIAAFHAQAERGPHISAFARFDAVAENARENLAYAASHVGVALSRAVFARLRRLTEETLQRHRESIERRAADDVPRDTHGDLRLDHVYWMPERNPPGDLIVIDCIEFNERFRYADPLADMAFLFMEFESHGRRDLARTLADAYLRAAHAEGARALLPFYAAYRAAVRGKVESIKMVEPEVPQQERARALAKARGYWLLALSELEHPDRRPGLVLIGGLPGTGKSTLAAELARVAGFCIIRSDSVRKALARESGQSAEAAPFERGIYTPEWTDRTYAECLRQAEELLFQGKRVIVDASFREDDRRRAFVEAAGRWCVPTIFLVCEADSAVVRERLARRRGDVSDADWSTYLAAAGSWQAPGPTTSKVQRRIATSGQTSPLEEAVAALRMLQLYERGQDTVAGGNGETDSKEIR